MTKYNATYIWMKVISFKFMLTIVLSFNSSLETLAQNNAMTPRTYVACYTESPFNIDGLPKEDATACLGKSKTKRYSYLFK